MLSFLMMLSICWHPSLLWIMLSWWLRSSLYVTATSISTQYTSMGCACVLSLNAAVSLLHSTWQAFVFHGCSALLFIYQPVHQYNKSNTDTVYFNACSNFEETQFIYTKMEITDQDAGSLASV